MCKDLRKIIKEAKCRGWKLIRHKKHYIYRHNITGKTVTVSSTTKNKHACKNIEKDFIKNEV